MDALAQLLFAAFQLGLPLQQSVFADAAGYGGQFWPQLGGDAGELQAIGGDASEQQIPQQTGQTLQ